MTDSPVGRNAFAEVVGLSWSEAKVVAALDVSPEEVASRRAAGTILALPTSDGVLVYPVDQFHRRDGSVEVKPALVPFLQALRAFDPWTVTVILHTPALELDDTTPLDWVSRGRSAETLLVLANVLAREWAAGTAHQASSGVPSNVGIDAASGLPAVSAGRPVAADEVSEALDD